MNHLKTTTPPPLTRASVVIPVFNQLHFTKDCIESLLTDPRRPVYEIIIVDNASTDGTAQWLVEAAAMITAAGRGDELVVITNAENRGVAPAWNQGCQRATAPWLAVLNNDILLTEGWIENLAWACGHHGLALVSPFTGNGPLDYDLTAKARQFTAVNRRGLWGTYDFSCVVMPTETFRRMGPFDEKFLVGGYEDTDYAYRLRAAGLRYGVSGAAYIHHFGSQTLGEFKKRGDQHAGHNRAYFIGKWGEDPSRFAGTWRGKALRWWRRTKLRLGRM